MTSELPEEPADKMEHGTVLIGLAPVVLPMLMFIGWGVRHMINKLVFQSSAELMYALNFFVLPMGIAFLAGVLIALAGVFVSNPKKLALVSYIAAFILGFVIYWAPDI